MRSFAFATLSAGLLLMTSVSSIYAAGPTHETIRDSFSDPDFCGTGETVNAEVKGVFNGFEDKAFGHIRTTWTNPANGLAVYDSFSGGGKVVFIDDGDGAYTVQVTRVGQPFRVQMVNGPVVLQDAGVIIALDHFDADDNYLGTDIVFEAGPHSGRNIDWCDLMIELLQL